MIGYVRSSASQRISLKICSSLSPAYQKALDRFSDDQSVRILMMHKSKGLEFKSVIILGIENEAFWGNADEERCSFFVGASRAKLRLVMTVCETREPPPSNPYRWREHRTPHAERSASTPSADIKNSMRLGLSLSIPVPRFIPLANVADALYRSASAARPIMW